VQTGVSDIPLTANGERMVKEMAPRMVGENSKSKSGSVRLVSLGTIYLSSKR
jgi:broad specificity phosphatase PhoE